MSTKIEDGGPVFPGYPTRGTINEAGDVVPVLPHFAGMSLRDWFAGQAMTAVGALVTAGQHQLPAPGPQGFASECYDLADAMLAARKAEGK